MAARGPRDGRTSRPRVTPAGRALPARVALCGVA
ncbi:hypothetical protein Y023_3977 [Burkholderia pseudomallei A79D]|nr:hypothetical protein X976_5026 [Burkholderia pseudomallei MSHR7500]KGX96685.1 hypothetical protein X997_5036 [Burkholderia pseudomallei A79C]KGX99077.1 hypothetical protein Y023_3977 [Burkholderia pseudomallei A79D]